LSASFAQESTIIFPVQKPELWRLVISGEIHNIPGAGRVLTMF